MSWLDPLLNLFRSPDGGVPEIRVDELAETLKSQPKTRLIDVRTPGEFKAVRAPRAENVPLSGLASAIAGLELPDDEPVYVICHSGNRSRQGARMMRRAGIQAVNVVGGTSAWLSQGLQTRRG